MDAIENGDAAIGHAPCDDFIGQEHKFFNEAMAIQAIPRENVDGMSRVVEDNKRFGNFKVNRAPCHAPLCQTTSQSFHVPENIGIRFGGIFTTCCCIDHALNLFIRQTRVAAYHRLCNLGVNQLAIGGNTRQNTQGQAIFAGL